MAAPIENRWRLAAAMALLAIVAAGCGGSAYDAGTVSGVVRIDNQPVPRGYITFSPTEKGQGPVAAAPIENGAYRCERVPVGKQNVTFTAQAAEATTVYDVVNKTTHEVPKNILPPKYNTGLPADVVAGENHRDFELQSGGNK